MIRIKALMLEKMINTLCRKNGGSPDNSVHFIIFLQKKLSKV